MGLGDEIVIWHCIEFHQEFPTSFLDSNSQKIDEHQQGNICDSPPQRAFVGNDVKASLTNQLETRV
jgi:hypothetical protein